MNGNDGDDALRVAVMGAGSIGCHVGGHLSASTDVTLIGRERIVSAVETNGITLSGGGSSRHVSPRALRATTSPAAASGAAVILVTTKSNATAAAVREFARYVTGDTVVISIQNGLRNPDVIRETLAEGIADPADLPVVVAATISYNVVFTPPATFHQATSGELIVDIHPGAAAFVDAGKRAGLDVRQRSDMPQVQAAKLLMNLNNAINALSGAPLREQLLDRDLRRCLALSQVEALRVCQAAGLRPARLLPLPPAAVPALLRAPTQVFRVLAARMLSVDETARSSMADDFDAGRPTEIDELQGAVVRMGTQHDVDTPVNSRIVELVREASAAGSSRRVWSGQELLAELA